MLNDKYSDWHSVMLLESQLLPSGVTAGQTGYKRETK